MTRRKTTEAPAPKRPFAREYGMFVDRYTDPTGQLCVMSFPLSTLDEALSDGERETALKNVASDTHGAHYMGVFALQDDPSDDYLEALLGSHALRIAVEHYESDLHTQAMRHLRAALLPLLRNADDDLFLLAAPALVQHEPEEVLERCGTLLAHDVSEVPRAAFSTLQQLPGHLMARTVSMVLEWLPEEPWLREKVHYASFLGPLLTAATLEDIVGQALRDESPSLRWIAGSLFSGLSRERRAVLAAQALEDEPDPVLRKRWQQYLGS